ncbi:iporin isoform X1 [Oncorhynchus kisutch]|uniref:Iporin n=1 Tax=Oncorhynchus kisutch TaxID=8019 RepID=A0A8C7G6C3_ONCKI|nr:iporin isoform X1 [Oncorhynchus kisutch]
MIRTASLSGDTLIACHFPLVQLPPWQLPVQAALCSGSSKRPGRLCSSSVGLTRAASLPEQGNLQREPFHNRLRHISSSYWSLNEDWVEGDGEGGSDSSGKCDSGSSSEEASQMTISQRHKQHPVVGGTLRLHNSFLPNEGVDEDEEDEDSDGDNLHRYHEDSSFVLQLHGNSNWALSNAGRQTSKPSSQSASQNHDNRGKTVLKDCGEQERLEDVEDNMLKCGDESYCFSYGQTKCFPESFSDGVLEYVTDSSCNSSDGVLVNFSAIYNKSNNPATPNDLSIPAMQSSQPAEGTVVLNLQPFPQEPQSPQAAGPSQEGRTTSFPLDGGPSVPCWSPQALDSNCNVYLPDAHGLLSSLEVSDLTSCLQSQARLLPTGTTQKYYKLVTCDLSSQSASPSPAWSSTTSVTSEGHYFLFSKARGEQSQEEKQQEEGLDKEGRRATPLHHPRCLSWDSQHVTSFAEIAYCKRHTDSCQSSSHSHTSQDLCPIQEAVSLGQSSSHSPLLLSPNQGSITVSNHPSVSPNHETEEEGACSWATPVVRYSKAQRPTSLPIQPFVLLPPAGKPQSQPLGSLLDQYISHKNTKPSFSSQPGSKCIGKGNRLLTHLHPSPLGSYGAILLEGPSSSDTCSTCTPSPERFQSRLNWTHSSPYRPHTNLGLTSTSPKQSQTSTKLTQAYSCQDQLYEDLDQIYPSPAQAHSSPNQSHCKDSIKRSQGMAQICQDLIRLSPEQKSLNPVLLTHSPHCPISHVATMSPSDSHIHHPDLLVSFSPDPPLLPHKTIPLSSVPTTGSAASHRSLTAALSSVAPLSSLSALLQPLVSAGPSVKQHQQQHCDSFSLSDSRPPVEFCLSPEASYESLSISHLQRRGLLKSVSLAVDLIMAHFGTSRDPVEKIRLGNSSRSPTIGGIVLEHLCPTIQNILQDGLRDHKLDLIIGHRHNHAWNVVEASTQTGPTTQVLHSLLSKVRQCSLLTSHCMRLRAFIMGLLNLRALEFWLNHLYNQKDMVTDHYHPWGFLAMSQGQCQPLFQELLLLLQPLSMLPFDLNLLLEPRLLQNRQLCSEEQAPPCSTFLMTSWPLLRGDRQGTYGSMDGPRDNSRPPGDPHQLVQHLQGSTQGSKVMGHEKWVRHLGKSSRSLWSVTSPGWWQRRPAHTEGGVEYGQIYMDVIHTEPQQGMEGRREGESSQEGRREGTGPETPRMPADPQDESLSQGGLRWAKLFGSGGNPPTRTQRAPQNLNGTQAQKRRPSQWLQLDRSQLGLLAHTVWSGKLPAPQPDQKHQT